MCVGCEVCGECLHVICASIKCVWFRVRVHRGYSIVGESRETTRYLCLCGGVCDVCGGGVGGEHTCFLLFLFLGGKGGGASIPGM